ncbi:hypothetical protein O6H91_06G146300 [Diphasiastrum complanatum]|uniref:Uncharacterized protein n=1 Tax=Diphasiastrum complanatum TaxID=34168 RepID=A0ACC2DK39_DIPCM|nr:hypothetical protein O6H91_06G146300 [Diphasiastrum complanatum]
MQSDLPLRKKRWKAHQNQLEKHTKTALQLAFIRFPSLHQIHSTTSMQHALQTTHAAPVANKPRIIPHHSRCGLQVERTGFHKNGWLPQRSGITCCEKRPIASRSSGRKDCYKCLQFAEPIHANQSLRVRLQAAIGCQATFCNSSKVSEKLFKQKTVLRTICLA